MLSRVSGPPWTWYLSLLLIVGIGVGVGYAVFFHVYPGKPKIGIIDIPFTVITDDSAFVISSFLEYARDRDDIKGVVIKLNSPGGGAAASETLFQEVRRFREEKPVVVSMRDIVASGAYMMSMGANYTYARPTSFVGSVGVVLSFPGPLLPSQPNEQVITTGPFKRGSNRRHFVAATDQAREAFAQIVLTERGERLRMSREQLLEAQIYPGVEGVRLGLVDAIGSDIDAVEKVAELSGVSDYDLVDVNTEVFRIFNQRLARIIEPLMFAGDGQGRSLLAALTGPSQPPRSSGDLPQTLFGLSGLGLLRNLYIPDGTRQIREALPPDFPLRMNQPGVYYLYVGPS